MKKMVRYSVIIAERNEPDLAATCANIRANSNAHVVVMSDRKGLGPQAMRDKGIWLTPGSDVVIIMDGHMRVQPGMLDAMAEYCARKPTSVVGTRCFHHYDITWTGKAYNGARFSWIDKGKDAGEPQSFAGKWRKSDAVGQIPCVMGACYGFTREWYINGLRRPWQYGTGWGCDEELISAATWLRGGSVELLPYAVWHRARKPGQVPYKITDMQLLGVWANRLRLLDMLPMSDDERKELVLNLMPALTAAQWRQVNAISDPEEVAEYREFLGSGPMDWADFKREIVGVETVKDYNMKELRAMATERGIKVPFGCKKADLTTLLQDGTGFGAMPVVEPTRPKTAASRANWGANEINNAGKRCCVHCSSDNTKVGRVMRAGKLITRYRSCGKCSKRFTTREIVSMP
jgi:hypothetical protein